MTDDEGSTRVFDVFSLLGDEGTQASVAQLVVIHGRNVGQRLELSQPRSGIGRRDTNHLVLDSATVSRVHAYIDCEEDCYFVVDAGSRNGVYVNGHRLAPWQRWRLSHGDSLVLGEEILLFHCPERRLNPQRLFDICIDPEAVRKETDDLLARFMPPGGRTE